MDEDISIINSNTKYEKIKNFFIRNKKYLVAFLSIIILLVFSYFAYSGIQDKKVKKLFFKNLFKIGYRYFDKNSRTEKDIFLIEAFQRRFLPNKVTGKIDQKTFKISHFLANHLKN